MLQPGTQIGRYEIQRRLGRGGMGTVYVAHDPVLGRMVAIKVFLGDLDLPDAPERFAREARSAAALNHANIVTVHDYGEFSSQPYIVMEYVQGETLAEIIRRKAPVSVAEKLRWMEELCAGVAYAHQVGVIHRDIKPANLMIDRSGRLKILDFGIARMLGTLAAPATALIGTPGYMAPEQILGRPIDNRSDLFSVGVVCYELLSHTEAFPGDTIPTITHRILSEEPAALAQLMPELRPELVGVVERGLKKVPDDRFADAESFRIALTQERRQLEKDSGSSWGASPPTIVRPGNASAAGTNKAGPASARPPVQGAVEVSKLTPSDPRLTDREGLERRRAAQIEAALELARERLRLGDLEGATDACEQALTLDVTHAGALELEQTIKAASSKHRASAVLAEARDELKKGRLTGAYDLLQQALALDRDAPDAKQLGRDLRLARVEHERARQRIEMLNKALDAAEQALKRAEVEKALAFAREALGLDPTSERGHQIEAEAMRRLDEDSSSMSLHALNSDEAPTVAPGPPAARPPGVGSAAPGPPVSAATVLSRRTPPPASPVSGKRPAVPATKHHPWREWLLWLNTFAASIQARVSRTPKREKLMIGWTAIAVLVVAVAATGVMLIPRGAVPTGTLVIEATPWATITAVQGEDGTLQPLPSPPSTPLSLSVPVGVYQIRFVGPPPEAEAREVRVQIQAGVVTATPVARFRTLTPEEYFEQYLTSPAAVPPPESTATPSAEPSQEAAIP